MGWLTDLTNWIKEQLLWLWNALVTLLNDFQVKFLDSVCGFFASIIESIPVPDFIANYSIGSLLANAGPEVAWVVTSLRIGEALLLIAAGYGFRLMRKLFTLGQW